MKICRKCHQTKPLTDFYTCKRTSDGRRGSCKACQRADAVIAYQRFKKTDAYDARLERDRERQKKKRRTAGIKPAKTGRGPLCHGKCKRVATIGDYCQQCHDQLALTGGAWVRVGPTMRWVA